MTWRVLSVSPSARLITGRHATEEMRAKLVRCHRKHCHVIGRRLPQRTRVQTSFMTWQAPSMRPYLKRLEHVVLTKLVPLQVGVQPTAVRRVQRRAIQRVLKLLRRRQVGSGGQCSPGQRETEGRFLVTRSRHAFAMAPVLATSWCVSCTSSSMNEVLNEVN
jgi:hypothetical protein